MNSKYILNDYSLMGIFIFIFSLSQLYNWRYNNLGNLNHVLIDSEYHKANAGFCFEYQLIDVGLFNGVGETEPNPHFIQVTLIYNIL